MLQDYVLKHKECEIQLGIKNSTQIIKFVHTDDIRRT